MAAIAIPSAEYGGAVRRDAAGCSATAQDDTSAATVSVLDENVMATSTALDHLLEQLGGAVPSDVSNVMLVEDSGAGYGGTGYGGTGYSGAGYGGAECCGRVIRWRGYDRFNAEGFIASYSFRLADTPLRRRMIETGQPVVVPDVRADPRWTRVRKEMEWLRSYAGAPIRFRGRTLGFLNVGSATPGSFGPAHGERLRALADQAAVALERWNVGTLER